MAGINLKSAYSKEDWESLNSLPFSTKWGQYVVEKSQTGIFYNELERDIVDKAMSQWIANNDKDTKFCHSKAISYHWKLLRYALRCNIARYLTGEGLRPFGIRLTDSNLCQWFTRINDFSS